VREPFSLLLGKTIHQSLYHLVYGVACFKLSNITFEGFDFSSYTPSMRPEKVFYMCVLCLTRPGVDSL